MLLEQLRHEVWAGNLELPKNDLVKGTSGNISGRDPGTNLVVIKPSGVRYEQLTPQDLVVVDLDGTIVEGALRPSTDTTTHLYIYRHRPDVFGVGHTHSVYASVFGVLGRPIPPCLTASAMLGGEVPIGGFVPIGGEDIGREVVDKIGKALVIIMQNHGVFTIGSSASQAAKMAVEVEDIAKITYLAMLAGEPIVLSPEDVALTAHLYTHDYGQPGH
jgi:L-ribulose-5-phosphate 4-epimerase